jgi:hypothetical protein
MYKKNVGHSPLMKEWKYFITEQQLSEVEAMHYTVDKKANIYQTWILEQGF